jgi:diacylglycerol kinase (CTP)
VKAVLRDAGFSGLQTGGWVGLAVVSIISGLVTGIAEALGTSFSPLFAFVESVVI